MCRLTIRACTAPSAITCRWLSRLPGGTSGGCPGADADEIRSIAYEALCQAGAKWIPYCQARGFSPWSESDPDQPEAHFGGYAAKTITGRILDWCRTQDYLPRAQRKTVKQLQAAQEHGARTGAELAAATGLPVEQIRKAQTAEAAKPRSLDDILLSADRGALHDERADTESELIARETMARFMAAFDALPAVQQVLLAHVFHQELDITVAAKAVYLEPADARRQLEQAVTAVHQALLQSVQDEGTGPRRPAPPPPPVRMIRSGDCCHAAEAGARVKRCPDCGELLPIGAFSWRDRAKGYKVPYCPPCASGRAAVAYVKRRKAARMTAVGGGAVSCVTGV
jgi:RNA polymerase sigma factor (sigma-70 family)